MRLSRHASLLSFQTQQTQQKQSFQAVGSGENSSLSTEEEHSSQRIVCLHS